MAFEGAMKAMGSAKPKMAPKMGGEKSKPEPKGKVEGEKPDQGEHAGNTESTTIEHHPDGSHTMDGETHPSHLHLMAALGHKLTGDKHHVAHHDGMAIHTHGISEMGEHQEGGSHNSAEEAGNAMKQFMDEEAQEPAHQGGGMEQHSMGEYGGKIARKFSDTMSIARPHFPEWMRIGAIKARTRIYGR